MRATSILTLLLALPATARSQDGAASRPGIDVLLRQLRSDDEDDVESAEHRLVELGAATLEALAGFVFGLEVLDEQAMLRVPWVGFRRDARLDAAYVPPESLLPGDRFVHGDDPAESPYDAVDAGIEPERRRDHDALWAASRVLARIGEPALPLLSRMLGDRARAHAAATVLGRLGALAVPVAEKALRSGDPIVRGEALRVLGLLGATTPDWLIPAIAAELRADDARTHKRAAWALARLGERAVLPLGALLDSDDVETKRRALGVTALLGTKGSALAERVVALLAHGDARLAPWAADAAGRLRPPAELGARAADSLARLAAGPARPARLAALLALGGLAENARAALPVLTKALRDRDEDVRLAATIAIGRLAARETLDELAKRLADGCPRVRRAAAEALVPFGERAIPCLLKALDPAATETLDAVVDALVRIGPAASAGLCGKALAGDPHVRRGAILGLGRLCAVAPDALKALEKLLAGEDEPMRRCAIRALGGAGAHGANRAVLLLMPQLRDESPYVRYDTAQALGALGPGARGAVPALMDALEDEVLDIRIAAAEALAEIGPAARAALQVLRQIARDAPEPLQAAARAAARSVAASPR